MCLVGLSDRMLRIDVDFQMQAVFHQQDLVWCCRLARVTGKLQRIFQGGLTIVCRNFQDFVLNAETGRIRPASRSKRNRFIEYVAGVCNHVRSTCHVKSAGLRFRSHGVGAIQRVVQ